MESVLTNVKVGQKGCGGSEGVVYGSIPNIFLKVAPLHGTTNRNRC